MAASLDAAFTMRLRLALEKKSLDFKPSTQDEERRTTAKVIGRKMRLMDSVSNRRARLEEMEIEQISKQAGYEQVTICVSHVSVSA